MIHRAPKVLYFAVRDTDYPRNERIRAYLTDVLGATVDVVPSIRKGSRMGRYFGQLGLALRQPRDYDVVVLSEFSLSFFPFSWLAAKRSRAKHVVDFFVGLYESEVGDAKTATPASFRAKVLLWIDRTAILSADACFTDTRLRARRFYEFGCKRTQFESLPVGAPEWARAPVLDPVSPGFRSAIRVLYYGSYLPLHGLSAFVEAMREAKEDTYIVTMIGRGPMRERVEALVRDHGLSRAFLFLDYAEPSLLAQHIRDSDIILGVFGESEKAAEVIPNKVWQGLSMGKVVVTRASGALSEISDVAGPLLVQVPSADPWDIRRGLSTARSGLCSGGAVGFRPDLVGQQLESLVRERFDSVFTAPTLHAFFRN